MPYKDPEKQKEYQRKWQKKRVDTMRAEDPEAYQAYRQKHRERNRRYRATEKGKETDAAYRRSPRRRVAEKKYRQTLRGKMQRRAQKDRRRYGEYAEVAYAARMIKRHLWTQKLKEIKNGQKKNNNSK